MKQPRLRQLRVTFLPERDKFLFGNAVSKMFILLPMLMDTQRGDGLLAPFGRIVMARPDLDVIGQAQDLPP